MLWITAALLVCNAESRYLQQTLQDSYIQSLAAEDAYRLENDYNRQLNDEEKAVISVGGEACEYLQPEDIKTYITSTFFYQYVCLIKPDSSKPDDLDSLCKHFSAAQNEIIMVLTSQQLNGLFSDIESRQADFRGSYRPIQLLYYRRPSRVAVAGGGAAVWSAVAGGGAAVWSAVAGGGAAVGELLSLVVGLPSGVPSLVVGLPSGSCCRWWWGCRLECRRWWWGCRLECRRWWWGCRLECRRWWWGCRRGVAVAGGGAAVGSTVAGGGAAV